MNIRNLLSARVREAMTAAGVPAELTPAVAPSKNPQFGDYQANGAMGAAKRMGLKPRDLAQSICDQLSLDDIASKVEIAGPGFINIHLSQAWLVAQLESASADARLGVEAKAANEADTLVIDYSSPNLAKEMHVGHLRSSIIGDALARIHEFSGDTVIRQNHVGDWGTQFGMLIAELEDQLGGGDSAELALKDLELFYQQSKKRFDDEDGFADRARDYVVKLQGGDTGILALWQKFREVSLQHSAEVYEKLNVSLRPEHVRGESAYNEDLSILVEELQQAGIAIEDQGAQVVALEELADKEGNPSIAIIQKKDGGYLYSTTDLAALRYRIGKLGATRIMVVVDDRQSLHLKQVFAIARKAGFAPQEMPLEHIAFGKMLGKDNKPFKTRTGGTVKLAALLDEAIEKAAQVGRANNPELSDDELAEIARKVGIGAVKYADLSKTRTNDYVFDLDAMLKFEGNTGPYIQYAYARIASIFRKANVDLTQAQFELALEANSEKALALKALQFSEVIEQIGADGFPHVLCSYLFELSSSFMTFFEDCPILKDGIDVKTRESRLQLSKAVAQTLKLGLELLGIDTLERM